METQYEQKQVVLRLSLSSIEWIEAVAKREKRSMSMQIAWLVEQAATQAAAPPTATPERTEATWVDKIRHERRE